MSVTSLSGLGTINPATFSRRETGAGNLPPAQSRNAEVSAAEQQSSNPFGLQGLQSQANFVQALNFSSSRSDFAFAGDGFAMRGFTEQISFGASIRNGDQLTQLNVEIQRTTVQFAAISQAAKGFDIDSLLARLPDDARNLVNSYMGGELPTGFFTPEATANRIADFALSGFPFFEGGKAAAEDSLDARQRYVDYIAPAIQKGFQEALDILGALPDQTKNELQQTRDLIQQRLDDFLNGPTDRQA